MDFRNEDHAPPHFHAKYQEQEITIEIQTGKIVGALGAKAVSLIQEWRELHMEELMADWDRAAKKQGLLPISPLE
jgi:hypothetical protein